MNSKWKFYLSRLKNASIAELLYRLRYLLTSVWVRGSSRIGLHVVNSMSMRSVPINHVSLPSLCSDIDRLEINDILAGKLYTLNSEQSDPGIYADPIPRNSSYECSVGESFDVRAFWEPARLQHLTTVMVFTMQHQDVPDRAALNEFVRESVLRWLAENRFPDGPHYTSAMECGLRTPVFLYCLKFLNNLETHESNALLEAIYNHGWWIYRRLSLYSSLGNHTVAEAVGLVFAGALFRDAGEGRSWLERGIALLSQEAEHQILPDGGPIEQSLSYHRFVLDLFWLAVGFLENNNLHDCTALKHFLLRGEEFLRSFCPGVGRSSAIGDSDDGHAVAPRVWPKRILPAVKKKRRHTFTDSGYSILRGINGSRLVFDHGPMGMAPLYNHGHADALSVTLSIDDIDLLVDPGTYRYNGVPEWRRYFRGTSAHNTVCIDGLDQAVQQTGFIWSNPCRCKQIDNVMFGDDVVLTALHDGYERLRDPVVHVRKIRLLEGTTFIIEDSFSGTGTHEFSLNFHLHPDAVAAKDNGWWHISRCGKQLYLRVSGDEECIAYRGHVNPLIGWYSPGYGQLVETTTLQCRKSGSSSKIRFATVIRCGDELESVNSSLFSMPG